MNSNVAGGLGALAGVATGGVMGGIAGGGLGVLAGDSGQYGKAAMKPTPETMWHDPLADATSAGQYRDMANQIGTGQNYFGGLDATDPQSRMLGTAARAQQVNGLGMLQQAAMGQTPSVAQLQLQAGNDAATRQQMGLAAAARGPQALGMAQYGAAQNVAALQQQNAQQQAILRAQEMANAQNAYTGAAGQLRTQDLGMLQAQAGLEAQRQNAQQGLLGLGNQASATAANSDIQQTGLNNQYLLGQQQQDLEGRKFDASNMKDMLKMGLGAATGGLGAL